MGTVWPSGGLLWLFCGFTGYLSLVFLAISISSALYLVAEAAEEHPSIAGMVLRYLLQIVFALHFILWIDGLPFFECFIGALTHGCYHLMLTKFPFVNIKSYEAPMAAIMFVVSHYMWFRYFMSEDDSIPNRDLLHIIGFLSIMVWAIPFGLFVSLTINDNILPGMGPKGAMGQNTPTGGGDKGSNLFKYVYDGFQNLVEYIANYTYTGAGRRPPKYRGGLGNSQGNGNGTMMMGGGSTMQGISSNDYYSNNTGSSNTTTMTGFGSAAHATHSQAHQAGGGSMGGGGLPGHGQAYYSGGHSMPALGGGESGPTTYVAPSNHYKPSQFASSRPLFNQAGAGQTVPTGSMPAGDYSTGSGSTTNTAPSAANLHSRAGKKAE